MLRLTGLGLASVAGCVGSNSETDADQPSDGTESRTATDRTGDTEMTTESSSANSVWRSAELTDILTDETFTVADQPGPVLLHSFAVWCPKCGRQHDHLKSLSEEVSDDVTLVSLNVDPNEDAATVREYAAADGYDWRFVVPPTAVTDSLIEAFGTSITSPPSVPVVVACPGGEASLLSQRGPKSVSYLTSHLEC